MGSKQPDIDYLIEAISDALIIGQVKVNHGEGNGFVLHHVEDSSEGGTENSLEEMTLDGLESLVSTAASGHFRPLKSAPNLKGGWIFRAGDSDQLFLALDVIYPGFVADYYFVSREGEKIAPDYFEFSGRQTGMYRLTGKISPKDLGYVVNGCCDRQFCLKSRRWTFDGDTPDGDGDPSIIPCLEPCAPLLELARIQAKASQTPPIELEFSDREIDVIKAALESGLHHPPADLREGEVYNTRNPKRIRIVLSKLNAILESGNENDDEKKSES